MSDNKNKTGYYLEYEDENVMCYINEEYEDVCLITDGNGKKLFKIKADCAQNSGYLKFSKK